MGHETDLYSGPESAAVSRGPGGPIRSHDHDHAPQRASGRTGPRACATCSSRHPCRRSPDHASAAARNKGPLSDSPDGRPGQPVSPGPEAPPPIRRMYLDTSAYLCILLGEEGSELLSQSTADAELLSSVLLVLEAKRNLIRLARDGTLKPDQYKACME